jgi:hypothetical protein
LIQSSGTCRWRRRQDHLNRDIPVPQIGKHARRVPP